MTTVQLRSVLRAQKKQRRKKAEAQLGATAERHYSVIV